MNDVVQIIVDGMTEKCSTVPDLASAHRHKSDLFSAYFVEQEMQERIYSVLLERVAW